MYRDKTLIPTEAIRLAALGMLCDGPQRYGALAAAVRHFASRVMGPSLDILGTSIELLRLEGLVEPVEGEVMAETALLRITAAGRGELQTLLKSRVRSPVDDLNKLVVALKMRFFHLLEPAERRHQLELLIEATEGEIARLEDLRRGQPAGLLAAWLAHDLAQLVACEDIERLPRLVPDDELGVGGEGPGEGYALHFPSAETGRIPVAQRSEVEPLEQRLGPSRGVEPPPDLESEPNVPFDRPVGEEAEPLGYVPEVPLLGPPVGDVDAVPDDPTPAGGEEPRERPQQGRLAGT